MKELSVILPIHKFSDEISTLIKRSVASFEAADYTKDTKLVVIAPQEIMGEVKAVITHGDTKFVEVTDSNTSFQSMINKAVKQCETKYFSILEFDDEYTDIWFKNVETYIKADCDASLMLPLTEIYDYTDKTYVPIAYNNEAVWASSFSEEIGYFDDQCLQDYLLFNTTGGVFVKSDFEEIGGLKESIKVSFWYEFLLRMMNNKKRVFTIPKVGYKHYVNRKDSLVETSTMSKKEYDFWINIAKTECMFKKDRNKTYEED